MRVVRFHTTLYSASAIEQAIEVFTEHAAFERRDQDPYVEIELEPKGEESADLLAGEFSNYALALTVEETRASSTPAS